MGPLIKTKISSWRSTFQSRSKRSKQGSSSYGSDSSSQPSRKTWKQLQNHSASTQAAADMNGDAELGLPLAAVEAAIVNGHVDKGAEWRY